MVTPWSSEEDAGLGVVGAVAGVIDLSGDGAGAAGAPEAPSPTTIGITVGRKKKSTSKVWNDFDELFPVRNGKKVRYGARCKYCGHEYSGKSSSGTGHLKMHALVCGKNIKLITWLNLF